MSKQVHLATGDILNDRYQIISHLNSGGMATVYLAQDLNTKTNWAIKESLIEEAWSKQLVTEAQILSELDHPHLPKIADFFSSKDKQYFYLVQEFIDGKTLHEWYEEKDKQLPVSMIVDVAIQLCDLLDFLHSKNIVYRDLKPKNVMIEKNGDVKLIDFGIARKYDEEKWCDTVRIGTVGFAAPEQFEKAQTDHRTDLFSLGSMMYFLLSQGRYVYTTRKPLHRLRKGLPKKLLRCIYSLTQLEPEKRCQSALKAKKMLEEVKMRDSAITSNALWMKYVLSILLLVGVLIYIGLDSGILL